MIKINNIRWVVMDTNGLYQPLRHDQSNTSLIHEAMMIHDYSDACCVANDLNKSSGDKWVVVKVNVTYVIDSEVSNNVK